MEAIDVSSRKAYLDAVASALRQLDILACSEHAEPVEKAALEASRSALRIIVKTKLTSPVHWGDKVKTNKEKVTQ